MDYNRWSVVCATETKLPPGRDPFILGGEDSGDGYLVFPSGQPHHTEPGKDSRGAAIILHPALAPEAKHRTISDRLTAVILPLNAVFSPSRCKTLAGSKTLIIIAAYAPHMGHSKGKARNIRRFYKNLEKLKAELLQDDPKAVIIMGGDFNARVTQDAPHTRHPAVGPYSGSLTENKNGSLLKAFCHRNRMAIVDSFYQHSATRKNTWLSNTFRKT